MDIKDLKHKLMNEALNAFGLQPKHPFRFLLKLLIDPAVQRFAYLAAEFDDNVINNGFCRAAEKILPIFINGFESKGDEQIPAFGPLLMIANHPGTYDGLLISSCLPRNDIKIIVSGVPFIRSLPATAEHLIYSSKDPVERMLVIRSAITHLRNEGALLLFPSGGIDPDPAFMTGVDDEIDQWSTSLDIFLKKEPDAFVQMVAVKGVLHPRWINSIWTKIRQSRRDRQRVAEFLQVIHQMLFPRNNCIHPELVFARPYRLDAKSINPIHQIIIRKMKRHLQKIKSSQT